MVICSENSNEDNSISSVKFQNLGCNGTMTKSSDTVSVQSNSSTNSTNNLSTDGDLISVSQLAIRTSGVNIVNSSDVHLGDIVNNNHNSHNYLGPNNYLGSVIIHKHLTIKDLEVNSDQRRHKHSTNDNTESDNCDNSLGNINPSFTPENNCDTQIKTAKLDDGLFIITNKNIENCNISTLLEIKKPRSRRKLFTALLLALICSIIGLIIFIYMKSTTNGDNLPGPIQRPNNGSGYFIYTALEDYGIVPRLNWSGQRVNDKCTDLHMPVKLIVISHTESTNCSTYFECVQQCLEVLKKHTINHGLIDIGYNFLIGGDGSIYEGRGFYKEGHHTMNFNNISFGIAFIGNFEKIKASEKQIESAQYLINISVEMELVTRNHKVNGALQLMPTTSPGKKLFEQIQKWPDWCKIPF
ncbi:uncharacterized protein LOC123295951 [Chrysoperla carnea]|uniref:uncharacterized protein LOC123295951 n=1 Tax=Chrysoperla carnea TaxID=189513 RepID=UPI001D06F450|nr:uncharacterized protein LOC123295951 [Chrysoperla carnea]